MSEEEFNERSLVDQQNKFLEYNDDRISKALQIAPKGSSIGLQLVPVLLHYNDAKLPGFVNTEKPWNGIALFEPTDEMRNVTDRFSKGFKLPGGGGGGGDIYGGGGGMYGGGGGGGGMYGGGSGKPFLESLLLMGSVGAAAMNSKSDFDYWAMIDKSKLNDEEMELLQQKLTAIELWGDRQGVELHFFITDLKNAQDNNFGSADKESAGSSQARLLKEEFYRTMIHVCGKYPVWWLTPAGADDETYNKALELLSVSFGVDKNKYIDIGNIHTISNAEFFGAALWQINKAMDSPFKSVLKMALLEGFIDPEGNSELLCDELKKNVLAEDSPPQTVDPYLIMIERLLNYYRKKKRDDVVELICKCLYNKVNIKLNERTKNKTNLSFKEEMMLHYTTEWKWDFDKIENLNNYEDWDFASVCELGNQLHGFMLDTYKNLKDELAKSVDQGTMISDEDLTVLGRKLFSFYKKAPSKIELIKRSSDAGLRQESVTWMPIIVRGKKPVWTVYRGNVTTEVARKVNIEKKLIKRGIHLAELVAWGTVNKLIDGGSFLHLISNPLPASLKEIQLLVKTINEFTPYKSISYLKNEALLHSPTLTHLLIIVNFVSNPNSKNLDEITLIYRNSYGETFSETRSGKEAIMRIAECCGKEMTPVMPKPKDFFRIFIPKSEYSVKMEKLLHQMILGQLDKRAAESL